MDWLLCHQANNEKISLLFSTSCFSAVMSFPRIACGTFVMASRCLMSVAMAVSAFSSFSVVACVFALHSSKCEVRRSTLVGERS